MAREHEFYLVPCTINEAEFWTIWRNEEKKSQIIDSVIIHDDIILYMMDTLKWIPSRNAARSGMPAGAGINYHGMTLFDEVSARNLKDVFSAWRDLFLNSPLVLKLTGEFITIVGEEQSGHYEKLFYNRNEIVKQFEKIISFAERLSEGEFYVYHCGI
jgi:hypothetical protein